MIMKKISLKNVKEGLSRDEMRSVKGGCIGDCWLSPDYTCCQCKKQFYAWYCSIVYGCSL